MIKYYNQEKKSNCFSINMSTFFLIAILLSLFFLSCDKDILNRVPTKEELDSKYESIWNKPEYQLANTAKNETYLTQEEKEVFYYLNLARLNPALFARTYVSGYDGDKGFSKGYAWEERKRSLIEELSSMNPLNLIYPDLEMYNLAHCFAYEGGMLGITGHYRGKTPCANNMWMMECCQYGGGKNGLSIVMNLLIDAGEDNAGLGHRRICLKDYPLVMGVSIQPHITFKFNAVLDFFCSIEHIIIPSYTEILHSENSTIEITFSDNIIGVLSFGLGNIEGFEEGYYFCWSGNGGLFYLGQSKEKAIKILYVCEKYGVHPGHYFM